MTDIRYHKGHVRVYSQAHKIHSYEEAMKAPADYLYIVPGELVMSDKEEVVFTIINPIK